MDGDFDRPGRAWFAALSATAAVVAIAFAVSTNLRLGGTAASVAVEDVGEAIAALVAALSCLYAARRHGGTLRHAWTLLGASAASWCVGEVAWSVYEVGLHRAVPFPSAADVGFVVAVPLAAAGILKLPASPSGYAARGRAVVDGAIVALSLVFVTWALGLNDVYLSAPMNDLGRLLAVVYPAADIVLLTLLALAIRKSVGDLRVAVVLLTAAFLCNLLADGSFAYLTLHGSYGLLGGVFDSTWGFGYILIGLAAAWPVRHAQQSTEDGPIELWQLAIPWIGVLAVIATECGLLVTGRSSDPVTGGIGAALGLLFVLSQVMALSDSLRLLARSRAAEAALLDSTSLLREVIRRAPVGIARMGEDFRVIDVNERLTEIFGLPSAAFAGMSMAAMLRPDELPGAIAGLGRLRQGEVDIIDSEGELRRGDGSAMWVRSMVTAARRPNGRVSYYVVIMEDLTTKHETEKAARANTEELERLNRLKSEFMSMVSHEFRTALTGIQGYSEMLATQDVSGDEVKEFARDINTDSLRLNRMITEMLDLDRIESGRIQMHFEPVDMAVLLGESVDRARVVTDKHKIVMQLDPAGSHVEGDADRLTQVVSNLLSNAIKYSPNGGEIMVKTRLHEGNLEVSVQDHGRGIPNEFITRIFGRYERYEPGARSQIVGTGLGLAIAQQIIQLHRGRIWVESTVGEGSTFTFAVPVASARRSSAGQKVA